MTLNTPHQEIPPGTLEMLILATLLRHKELHGFGIADAIARTSAEVLRVEEGSLYPALQRLLLQGWITGRWDRTEGNRRARFYRLTSAGRAQVAREVSGWRRIVSAIDLVVAPA
jgi:transcriptional regulator